MECEVFSSLTLPNFKTILVTLFAQRDVKPANIIYSRSGTSSTSTCDSKDSEVREVDGKDTTDIKSTKGDGDSLKLIDFGTAIGVKDSKNDVGSDASESLMTFSKLEFAG